MWSPTIKCGILASYTISTFPMDICGESGFKKNKNLVRKLACLGPRDYMQKAGKEKRILIKRISVYQEKLMLCCVGPTERVSTQGRNGTPLICWHQEVYLKPDPCRCHLVHSHAHFHFSPQLYDVCIIVWKKIELK